MSFLITKKEAKRMSDNSLDDEISGDMNYIETCEQVIADCDLTKDDKRVLNDIHRELRQEWNILTREKNMRF